MERWRPAGVERVDFLHPNFKEVVMLRLAKFAAAAGVAAAVVAPSVHAETAAQEARAVLLKADAALQNFQNDPNYVAAVTHALRIGRAALIVPDYVRGGIGIGGALGNGVLVQKDGTNWSVPQFFNIRAANIGLQLGYQKGDLLLVIANTETLNAILAGEFTLSADAAVQAGREGKRSEASTTTAFKETGVVAFLRGEGAYAGATLGGAKISPNEELNKVQPSAEDAERLRGTLARITGPSAASR
jgi:lipid-binding SYLF domain-containing protein